MTDIFSSKGYEEVRKVADDIKKRREVAFTEELRIGDGESRIVRFLSEEPLNYYEHTIQRISQSGKAYWDRLTCLREDCPLCRAVVDKSSKVGSASYRGAYIVIDRTEEEVEKEGRKVRVKDIVKYYRPGIRVLEQLEKISGKYGLTSQDIELTRTGTSFHTQYNFIPQLPAKPLEDAEKKMMEELDLRKILAPKSREELSVILGGSSEESGNDIPF